MHGLLLRSLQGYVLATFGLALWSRIVSRAGQSSPEFEPLMPYGRTVVDVMIAATAAELARPAEAVLEDVGTWIIANPRYTGIRQLLRFGGATFPDFLLSLEELPDRARLALADLVLPPLTMTERAPGAFLLDCRLDRPDLRHVLIGVIRAMADDYGALVVIDPEGETAISVLVLAAQFAEGRRFDLAEAG